ncbi:MAG: protein translocase subunit SecD [Actinomyces sp.]|nr:protein translocase subunit SecD [Actinomyces sp.]
MANKKRRPVRTLVALFVVVAIGIAALLIGRATQGATLHPKLALDLEGGTQLILTPNTTGEDDRNITDEDITEAINIIRNRVDASGVSESEITSMGSNNIVVSLPGRPSEETLNLIRSSSQMDFRPVLQVGAAVAPRQQLEAAQSGDSGQSGAGSAQSGDAADQPQSQTLVSTAMSEDEARQAADQDKDGKLSTEPATTPENNSDSAWMTEQVVFDFLTLDCMSTEARTQTTPGDPDKPYATCSDDGTQKFLLGPIDVKGENLNSAQAAMDYNQTGQATGEWVVSLEFDSVGTEAFKEASTRLVGFQNSDPTRNRFAVVLDNRVITSPSMNAAITDGHAKISGNFTPTSAKALANQLNFGSLPLDFTVQSEQQISATLGSDHLAKGLWAGLIGLILVVLFMIWQYRGLSIISIGSLLMAGVITYLVITLLSWLMEYRLSLPGVVGLIVAVGVTADSFIVYFERIRDEVRDGRPLVAAVDEGWERAKRTIMISDAVNLVAAVVLYMLAVGGLQGFAFTLGVTTVVDLAVIFFFTHPMMELLIRIPFFGEGHKLSGLDPEHLGAKSSAIYAARARTDVRKTKSVSMPSGSTAVGTRKSLAEQRREQAAAAKQEEAR